MWLMANEEHYRRRFLQLLICPKTTYKSPSRHQSCRAVRMKSLRAKLYPLSMESPPLIVIVYWFNSKQYGRYRNILCKLLRTANILTDFRSLCI